MLGRELGLWGSREDLVTAGFGHALQSLFHWRLSSFFPMVSSGEPLGGEAFCGLGRLSFTHKSLA